MADQPRQGVLPPTSPIVRAKFPISRNVFTDVQSLGSNLSIGDGKAKPAKKPKSAIAVIRAYGVLAYCARRWGEATGVCVQDVDMIRRRLNVNRNAVDVGGKIRVGTPKSHERRSAPFPESLAPAIGEACKGKHLEDLVFLNGERPYLRAISHGSRRGIWFLKAVQWAGIPRVTSHDLRQAAARFAVSAGTSEKAVQRIFGHSSASIILDGYAELFDGVLDGVAIAFNNVVS